MKLYREDVGTNALFLRIGDASAHAPRQPKQRNKRMNTANSSMQGRSGSAAIEQPKSALIRASQFLSHLLAYTIAAFTMATLTLFGLNAGLDYAPPTAARAAPALAQKHAGLPAFAENIAAACSQGPQATMLATPAAHCMAVAAMAMQHLVGAAGAGGLMERLGVTMASVAVNGLQKAVKLTAPAWLGYGHKGRGFSLQ